MNRFRTKKKAKEEAAPRPSQDSESHTPFRLFGKGKKTQDEEPKKEFDIAAALPPTDDFRTSLLMSGLSARFSMLKEQDDPASKIGKASDDSVLLPKRASRMDFGGLGDIAEVESIKAPPSFARMDSYHSSDGSLSGSVMDRGKPVDGNNLFGGRQKIYKIPTAANSKPHEGSMGKALYENDVAKSAFQQWRQNEKNRRSWEGEEDDQITSSLDLMRTESPPLAGHNRKRETNSTTSSAPSAGRNSTAATSVMSQPSNPKDLQPLNTGAASGPSVTRTRRLYETGLMNELQESQSSAMSRMDTLSRRNLGNRTPDLSNGPSPINERFSDRKIMSKASAPNLRSKSPTAASPTLGVIDLGIRMPSNPESKSPQVSAAPLSPPISESEETSPFAIQPNDRGKATAMGMFNKPARPYDESMYAQKQLQLQRGRETPVNETQDEPSAQDEPTASQSNTARSRSPSLAPLPRLAYERPDSNVQTQPTVEEATPAPRTTFLDMDEDPPNADPTTAPKQSANPPQRPSDQDHPAFRSATVPLPESAESKAAASPAVKTEMPSIVPPSSHSSPDDSPTLGPTSAGLSGIVRQHLRTASDASSNYGGDDANGPNDRYSTYQSKNIVDLGVPSNPWEARESRYLQPGSDDKATVPQAQPEVQGDAQADTTTGLKASSPSGAIPEATPASDQNSETAGEQDDFARYLADGARRVREKLTTYVETESRDVSPQPPESRDGPPSRPNALNRLKSMSSRGSLADRNRDQDSSRNAKTMGISPATVGSSPAPTPSRQHSFDMDKDPLSPADEESDRIVPGPGAQRDSPEASAQAEQDEREESEEKDENMHAGLRAFRQARRELQKMKEVETQQRRQPPAGPPPGPPPRRAPSREQSQGPRSPSRGRRPPPPAFFQHRIPSDDSHQAPGPGRSSSSRPGSRQERERSGSENSNGSRSQSRPPMLRDISVPYEKLAPNGPPSGPFNGPPHAAGRAARSPGLPGTDIRKSPIMPPQARPPTGPLPGPPGSSNRAAAGSPRLQVQTRGHSGNQPSPISPMAPMASPLANSGMNSGAPTPAASSPRRPSQPPTPSFDSHGGNRLDDSMRKSIRKRDISEPTFVSSTSRVPTVGLPDGGSGSRSGSRSRSGSLLGSTASTPNLHGQVNAAGVPPPVPPINPRRRNMSSARRPPDGEDAAGPPNVASPPLPGNRRHEGKSSFSDDEDEPGHERRRLRKATSEANGINVRARQAQFGGAHVPPPMPDNRPRLPGGMI